MSKCAIKDIGLLAPIHKEHLSRYPLRTGQSILPIDRFEGTAIEVLEACCLALRGDPKNRGYVEY